MSTRRFHESENNDKHEIGRRNKAKVLIVMSVAVILGALGDVSLSRGMKTIGAADFDRASQAFVAAVTNPYVLGGVVLLLSFLILYLVSLSWEDLSFVLPLTAADYILVTVFAHLILQESVPPMRWLGSVLVASGIVLVARS